jgi:hypothetical protein
VLIIVGIIFGAILDEIDRCQPEVKDNNTVHRHTSKENITVNSNKKNYSTDKLGLTIFFFLRPKQKDLPYFFYLSYTVFI